MCKDRKSYWANVVDNSLFLEETCAQQRNVCLDGDMWYLFYMRKPVNTGNEQLQSLRRYATLHPAHMWWGTRKKAGEEKMRETKN